MGAAAERSGWQGGGGIEVIVYAADPELAELERRQAAIAALPMWIQRKHLRVLMSERLCPREEFDRWLALKREEFYGSCGQEVTT